MRQRGKDVLVNRLAEVAGKAPSISAYVIVYQQKDGTVRYHRDGKDCTQIGMLDLLKTGIINGLRDEKEGEDQ